MEDLHMSSVSNIIFGTMTLGYQGYGSRVHDAETAGEMFDVFASAGHRNVDTAHGYGNGSCEQMLGDLGVPKDFSVATRFEPLSTPNGHDPDVLKKSVRTSLARLRTDSVALLYLAYRDSGTLLEDTLRAVDELHREGLFGEFGLSNYSAGDVRTILDLCSQNGWVRPTVYQGLYNAVSRRVEDELLADLAEFGMRFHAYNPLAGGAFAPSFTSREAAPGSRWDPNLPQGQLYRARYLNPAYLAVLDAVREASEQAGVSPISAALRWLVHHSQLRGEAGDGILLGASSPAHLSQNLAAVTEGPLPTAVVSAINDAAEIARPNWAEIYRVV
jgi:aflatoxin B1 aldehyde reductase